MSGISAKELDERLAFARKYLAAAHLRQVGLILYPASDPGPSCSICGGNNAPIVDGMHLEGFCGCSGLWTEDAYDWQERVDLWAPLSGPPMATWEGSGCPHPAFGTTLSGEAQRVLRSIAHEVYPVRITSEAIAEELEIAGMVTNGSITEKGWEVAQRLFPWDYRA